MVTGNNAPQNRVFQFLERRGVAKNNPLPQYFTQLQDVATYISPSNTFRLIKLTPLRHNSDSCNPINRLAYATAGIASQQ